tara:strand:- start:434 stop:898 length:465 start_codon:yes stop_codon:yes gene_type:complete
MSHIEAFVSAYQASFPGTPTPPMPSTPDDLSLSVQLALRQNSPSVWQSMFGGHGAPLPADVAMRVAKGEIYPEDASALRASNYDEWAAVADQHRESILERTRNATREREKAIHQEQMERQHQWSEMSLLERMSANPVSEVAAAQAREQWGITGR